MGWTRGGRLPRSGDSSNTDRNQPVPQHEIIGRDFFRVQIPAPGFAFVVVFVGAVQAHDWAEDSELNPAEI